MCTTKRKFKKIKPYVQNVCGLLVFAVLQIVVRPFVLFLLAIVFSVLLLLAIVLSILLLLAIVLSVLLLLAIVLSILLLLAIVLSILLLLTIVLSILLRYTDSVYPFGISKLLLMYKLISLQKKLKLLSVTLKFISIC